MMYIKNEFLKLLKYGIGLIIFTSIVLFVTEKTIAYMVSNSNDTQTGKVNLVMAHKIDPQILIVGSSVAEKEFNSNLISKLCNKTVYNCALDGTTIIQSRFILDEFLDYSKKCEKIIIGLAYFSFSDKKSMTEPSRYLAHFSNRYVQNNIKTISPNLFQKLKKVPFYSFTQAKHVYYKNAYFGLSSIIKGHGLKPDTLNGFLPNDSKWSVKTIDEDKFGKSKINISPTTISTYIDIIERIKSHNIDPIIVINPMFINGQKFYKNYNDYIATAHEICSKTNITILDFSNSNLIYDKENFYNHGHLNLLGANKFSNQISDSLLNQ